MQHYFKTKLIIRSKDLITGNNYNGGINLQNIDVGYYKLLNFSFGKNLYNVNSYYNNKIYIKEGVTNTTIALTNGYYTSNEFATHVQSILNSSVLVGTFRVTYNDNTNKLSISSTSNFGFQFATSHNSDISIGLNANKFIFINFDSFSNKQRMISSVNNFPSSIVIKDDGDNFGGTYHYEQQDKYDQYGYIDKKNITWKIYDENNKSIVEMPDWVMVLELINQTEFM